MARPLALRVTWLVLPWGISAHAATGAAWLVSLLAVASFAVGTPASWLLGALLLQAWYLLDHVDGQLARCRGTASLDGVQLDYLMHHSVQLLVPWGIGEGLATLDRPWARPLAIAWGLGQLLLGLVNDTRYKAFVQRLKRVEGRLEVIGCLPSSRQEPAHRPNGMRWLMRIGRKLCEAHVLLSLLSTLSIGMSIGDDRRLESGAVFLVVMGVIAPATALAAIVRSVTCGNAEREFAQWYHVPTNHELVFEAGRWRVVPLADKGSGEIAQTRQSNSPSSS